jgi:hypothetical protein
MCASVRVILKPVRGVKARGGSPFRDAPSADHGYTSVLKGSSRSIHVGTRKTVNYSRVG